MPSVEELILLAAPSCCGKTRFLEEAFDGRHDELLALLRISGPISSYVVVTALGDLAVHGDARIARMILHYTIPAIPLIEGRLERISDDRRLDFIRESRNVTAITLLASAGVLTARLRLRHRASRKLIYKGVRKYLSVQKKLNKLQRIYDQPANIVDVYEAWLRYARTLPNLGNSWLVTAEDAYEVYELADWHKIREAYFSVSPVLASSRT